MRKVETLLLVLGAIALLALALPWIGTIAAITFIGLPLAFAYWAAPAAFLLCLLAYLINKVLPLRGKPGAALSLMAAAALLAVPPFLMNGAIHNKATSFTTGDLDVVQPPLGARTIASRERFRFARDTTQCDSFCLHALLTGTADRFLVANTDTPHGDIARDAEAIEFRLERRDSCPQVSFKSGTRGLKFRSVKSDTERAADPVETLKLRISEGECLVSQPATLGDADIVISRGALTKGTRRIDTGFSFAIDTVAAKRTSVHLKNDSGRFEEMYRATQVRYRPFGRLLVPWITMGSELRTYFGWWRTSEWINVERRYDDPYAWTDFLTAKLGFDLKLKGEDTKIKTLVRLRTLLDEGTPPNAADWALFSQYFDRIGIGRNTKLSAEDFALALRMLESDAYPAPPRLHNLVAYARRNAGDADMAHLADLFVSRLSADPATHEALGEKPRDQIRGLSLGIRMLPAAALLPHKDTMIALADRADIQHHGYIALQRLAVYGDDAVPALLSLMKAGIEGGEHFFRDNRFQHPYLGGLLGLCLAGESAASALRELRSLIAAGHLPDHSSYGRLLFTTLLRLGEDEDSVKALYVAAARDKEKATDKRFDQLATRAFREDRACRF